MRLKFRSTKIGKRNTLFEKLSIKFGNPAPPLLYNPDLFFLGVFVGLAVILAATFLADRIGTAMFHRGFAKPFYIRGRRIHHSCIYYIIPSCYAIFVCLFFLGYIQPVWNSLWARLSDATTLVIIAVAIDFLGDKFWPKIRKNVIWHHEWIYTVIPAYIFVYVVNVII